MAIVPCLNLSERFVKLAIFQKKGNSKRKSKHLLSSDRLLGITFLVSLSIHLLAIYTIPAVDLFSEGVGATTGETIEVDLMEEELPDESLEALIRTENQFVAAQPMPAAMVPPPDKDVPVEEVDISTLPEVAMPSEGAMLLAQTLERDPELMLERMRPTPEPTISRKRPTELTPLEKLPARQESVLPDVRDPETPAPPKSPVDPNQSEQEKPVAEDRLQFPSNLPTLSLSSADRLPEQPVDQSPGFSGKRVARPLTEEMPPPVTRTDGIAGSKQRLVGLDKTSSQDRNRFGIFSGEKFELPQVTDAVQEAALTPDAATTLAEELEQAKPLDLNTQIEGPLRGRAIVYKPTPPQLTDIENDVELRLKFWVLPDGTIGEVIPLKRGDARLEQIAIAYLKQWQFEPLRSDVPQEKIWGTIPIIFTSQ